MAALQPHWKLVAASKPRSSSYIYESLFGDAAKPAVRAVFDTMELAEMIFGELCMRDLLLNVQKTCKNWKSTIDESSQLQVALFFRPINDVRLVYHGRTSDEHYDMKFDWTIDKAAAIDPHPPVFEHPIVTNKCSKTRKYASRWYDGPEYKAMGRPEASWRRQLVTQPPLAELGYWYREGDEFVTDVIRATTSAGVTLGDFADGLTFRFSNKNETWSWQAIGWDHAPCVSTIEPARRASYTEGQWVSQEQRL